MAVNNYLALALELAPSHSSEKMALFIDGAYTIIGNPLTLIGYRQSYQGSPLVYIALYSYNSADYQTFIDALTPYVEGEASLLNPIFLGDYAGGFPRPSYNMIIGYSFIDVPNYVIADTATNLLYTDSSYSATPCTLYVYYALLNNNIRPTNFPWFATAPFPTSSDGVFIEGNGGTVIDNLGEILEFRHFHSLPRNTSRSAEIQCNNNVLDTPFFIKADINKHSDLFFVDLSILTFNSPDIEFDTNLQTLSEEGVELLIVGYIPITGTVTDYDLQTSTPALNYRADEKNAGAYKTVAEGFYKEGIGETSININGFKGLVTTNAWLDEMYSSKEKLYNNNQITYGFPVYPWHRKGSMNNQSYNSTSNEKDDTAPDNYRSAMLKTKKMSNLRFSFNSLYLSSSETISYNLNGLLVFSSDLPTNTRLLSPTGESVNYYGNIDKLVNNMSNFYIDDNNVLQAGTNINKATLTGYRLAATVGYAPSNRHSMFSVNPIWITKNDDSLPNWKDALSVDPIEMKYKSGIHAILSLKANGSTINILPTMNSINSRASIQGSPFWNNTSTISTSLESIAKDCSYGYLWLANLVRPRTEEEEKYRFGGKDNDAIQANNWIPCGKAVSLDDVDANGYIVVEWTEGDTFYQRYDCLKTYPFTMEDTNSIVDILSFRCETRINLDGRYDKNRGLTNNLVMHPTIFNRFNEIYNQKNNFFNYRILDNTLFNFDKYPYSVTWTKTKSNGEKIDTWTNITMASTMDLDGDKGEVTALRKTGDLIIAFLPKGISHILYNEQTLIATTEGVPIEISNSNKVTGKRYISDTVGCYNKWSICSTPNGLYFFDSYNKQLYLYNGLLQSISDTKGMHTWFANNCPTEKWNPLSFDGIVSYYDMVNQDVLFISRANCLAFSEGLGVFTSFYNYQKTPYFFNFKGSGYWLRTNVETLNITTASEILQGLITNNNSYVGLNGDCKYIDSSSILIWENAGVLNSSISPTIVAENTCPTLSSVVNSNIVNNVNFQTVGCKLWKHNAGDYNYFFGRYYPFSTTVIVNPEPTLDKIFATLDFRADSFDKDATEHFNTFDCLETWNEYQKGESELSDEKDKPSNLKKKFRVWRALIPRNNLSSKNKRDRMRNTWMYLKLSKNTENTYRTILHDMIVHYFI